MSPHPTSNLHPLAKVHPSADIGAETIIEADVEVQKNVKIGSHCIIRKGTLVREGAHVGNNCDLDAFYIGYRSRVGDGVLMARNSGIGDRARLGNSVHLQTQAQVGRAATVDSGSTLGARTYVHAAAHVGARVTTGTDVRIGPSAGVGADTKLWENVKVAPKCDIGERTEIAENVRVGEDGGVDILPPATIGNDCGVGDNAILGADTRMGDGCTLNSKARLDYRSQMETGSTVGIGSRVKLEATVKAGETVPPSTIVHADGTQTPNEDDGRKATAKVDDDEAYHNPDQRPPARPETAEPPPTVWVVIDINGEPYPDHGYFEAEDDCNHHIRMNIDSTDDRMYDRDSMFDSQAVRRAASDRDAEGSGIWVVKTDRFLAAQEGYFTSRHQAVKNRDADESVVRIEPARREERNHERSGPDPTERISDLRPTPPPAPEPASDALRAADRRGHDGPSR